jgi:DNA-binding MarR family transcriptional regulator
MADKILDEAHPWDHPEADPKYRLVCQAIYARQARKRYLDADLLGEPVWDILLSLYRDRIAGASVTVESASAATGLPASTATRWLSVLEHRGLIARHKAHDEQLFELTDQALGKLEAYVEHIRRTMLRRI